MPDHPLVVHISSEFRSIASQSSFSLGKKLHASAVSFILWSSGV